MSVALCFAPFKGELAGQPWITAQVQADRKWHYGARNPGVVSSLGDRLAQVEFKELLTLCKVAWRPVLELLAKEGDYSTIDFTKLEGAHPWLLGQTKSFPLDLQSLVSRRTPAQMRFLTFDEVLTIHDSMVEEFGGAPGIRDSGILESLLERAQRRSMYGEQEFPTIVHRAAWLMHSIALYHPFLDGQKRTGVSSAFVFLGLNDFTFWSRDVADEIRMAIRCAEGKIEVNEIATWMSDHVLPIEETLFIAPYSMFLKRMSRTALCPYCEQKVRWKSLLNRCETCGRVYQVRMRSFMLASGYTADKAAEVAASDATAPIADGEESETLRERQKAIDSANEDAAKRIRALGLDPTEYMIS